MADHRTMEDVDLVDGTLPRLGVLSVDVSNFANF
jgi:hypothetical protein